MQTYYEESPIDRENKTRHRNEILSQILDNEGYSIILDDNNGTCAQWMEKSIFRKHTIYFVNFTEDMECDESCDSIDIKYDNNKIFLNMRLCEAIEYIYKIEKSKCSLIWYDSINGFAPNKPTSKLRSGFKYPKANLITMITNKMFGPKSKIYLNLNNARHNKAKGVNQKLKVIAFLNNKIISKNGYSINCVKLEPYTDKVQQMLFYEFLITSN